MSPLLGWVAVHSGRSIGVAPTKSAAPRVLIRISSRVLNLSDKVPPSLPLVEPVSANHSPEPSSLKRATYKVPLSRYLAPTARRSVRWASLGSQLASDTKRYTYSKRESSPL